MSESRFTKGPWVAIKYSVALSTSSGAWHVAECHHGLGHDDAEALANATLIAAAPDLYEVADNARACLRHIHDRLVDHPEFETLRHTINEDVRALTTALSAATSASSTVREA